MKDRLRYRIDFLYRVKILRLEPLLILSNGKSATSSLELSLSPYPQYAIFQLHTLNKETIEARVAHRAAANHPYPSTLMNSLTLHKAIPGLKNLKIVSVVRDPLAAKASSFFQSIERREPELYAKCLETQDSTPLLEKFDSGTYQRLDWFEREIRQPFGLDVFATPFSRKDGFCTYAHGSVKLLVMKLEMLDDRVGDAMKAFLGIDDFVLQSANVGSTKKYAHLYTDFINRNIYPDAVIEAVYSNKYVGHFYTAEEIDGFRARWKGQ